MPEHCTRDASLFLRPPLLSSLLLFQWCSHPLHLSTPLSLALSNTLLLSLTIYPLLSLTPHPLSPTLSGKSTLLKIMTGELLPLTGAVRPHAHLRISKFTQHFIDALDLSMTPLDYFLALWPDLTREDGRKFLGRFGISG